MRVQHHMTDGMQIFSLLEGGGTGSEQTDPRHWCLHTCWFKFHTNRFLHGHFCYTYNFPLPHNIPCTLTEGTFYEEILNGL